jgi:ketosteroid isomerase-like protein
MALRRAAAALALALTACLIASGCADGDSDERRAQLRLPPAPTATPSPTATPAPRVSRARAQRMRPVIAAWADAVRAGDFRAAAKFFDLPAVVSQGVPLELTTTDQAETFNSGFPCGATLEEVQQDGRFVVGTFRLTKRPGAECGDVGELVRVAFVFRGRRFSEWYQVPDGRGAAPGPRRRPEVGGERTES